MGLTEKQLRDVSGILATAVNLHQQGELQQAESLYRQVLDIDPRNADAFNLLGVIAKQIGELEASCKLIKRAIRINPQEAQFHYNLGVTYQEMGEQLKAVSAYQQCIRLNAGYLQAYENLSIVYRDQNNTRAAYDICEKALALSESSLTANYNMAALLFNSGRHREALGYVERVLEMSPAYADAHWLKSAILLSQGDFELGWAEYEWRYFVREHTASNAVRVIPFPVWDGSSLVGKKILITSEQGVGDEVLFSSCFHEISSQAGKCVIECDPRLVELFSRSFPQATFIARSEERDFCWNSDMPNFDFQLSAGSLPRFFRRRIGDFSTASDYLGVDRELKQKWNRKLSQLTHPINIGISWRGGVVDKVKAARSIPLDLWVTLFRNHDANFINLQYGDCRREIDSFNKKHRLHLHDFEELDALRNIDDLCALISELDLVISIDNSTAHMAGAVGTPVWVLLSNNPVWVWGESRENTEWYRSARLFRQDETGNNAWQGVLRDVDAQLAIYLEQGSLVSHEQQLSVPRISVQEPNVAQMPTAVSKALILNDTSSWYHWGCSCTSLAIHARLRESWGSVVSLPIYDTSRLLGLPDSIEGFDDDDIYQQFTQVNLGIIERLGDVDAVYVNGEGSLHGISSIAVGLLYLSYIAKTRLKKQVRIINHSCYPEDNLVVSDSVVFQMYKKVYRVVDTVAVREPASYRLVSKMGIDARLSFDCLPLFVERYYVEKSKSPDKKITIAGSVAWSDKTIRVIGDAIVKLFDMGYTVTFLIGAKANLAPDDVVCAELLKKQSGNAFQLYLATSELDWLRTIADSILLISGRFHHSIAAAALDTPFLLLESNTPKVDGLMEALSINTRVFASDPDLADTLISRAVDLIESPEQYLLTHETKQKLVDLAEQNFVI
ncbi:tetratricopeptide repeat protein [Sedimenticola sp.]|uniref:tetratricopeptide repeat protein n=1 Tax=Sedimenticola sp. TaxID=1940285 RepID=UPI003D0EA3D1